MRKFAQTITQRRRQPARSISGQISIVPLSLTTALACLVVFGVVCMKINDGHNESDEHNQSKTTLTPSTIEIQGAATETDTNRYNGRPDGSRRIDTQAPTSERELLESLMLERARQIRSRRAKGVQIAMGGPDDSLSPNNVISPTESAFE